MKINSYDFKCKLFDSQNKKNKFLAHSKRLKDKSKFAPTGKPAEEYFKWLFETKIKTEVNNALDEIENEKIDNKPYVNFVYKCKDTYTSSSIEEYDVYFVFLNRIFDTFVDGSEEYYILIDDKNIMINGVIIMGLDEETNIEDVITVLNNNSKIEVIAFVEISLAFLIINFILIIMILKYVEKLFSNIKNNNTPFTMDNVNYIKRISYLLIVLIIINPISSMLINMLLNNKGIIINLELISILEILIIFSMSYIFEYGYEMQKDSNARMYNEEQNNL